MKRRRVDPLNLANLLTAFRIAAVPFILYLMVADWGPPGPAGDYGKVAALILTLAAGITDWVDGEVARRYHIETKLGKFLDPVADKLLVDSMFVLLVAQGSISPWLVIVMMWREFLVFGLRMQLASEGHVLAASHWAKFKTIFQCAALVTILLVDALVVLAMSGVMTVRWVSLIYFAEIARSTVLVSVVFSVVSGLEYFINHWDELKRG